MKFHIPVRTVFVDDFLQDVLEGYIGRLCESICLGFIRGSLLVDYDIMLHESLNHCFKKIASWALITSIGQSKWNQMWS